MPNLNRPCSIHAAYLARAHMRKAPNDRSASPLRGTGDRCLFCEHYTRCLDHAAEKDWEAFNCQGCPLAGRAGITFRYAEFEDIEDEQDEDFVFCSEAEMDRLLKPINHQEDYLIALISEGVLNEKQ